MAQLELHLQMARRMSEDRKTIALTEDEAGMYDVATRALYANHLGAAYTILLTMPQHVQEAIDDGVWHFLDTLNAGFDTPHRSSIA